MPLSAVETLHPDIFVIEERGIPSVIGVGVNSGGFEGVTEKGPIDHAVLITSLSQYSLRFGNEPNGGFTRTAVRNFFDEGGTRCFVVRVVGLGALTASGALANHEGSASIEVDASSPGAWGNGVSVTTERWRTTVAPSPPGPPIPPVGNGSTLIPVFSIRNVKRGDLVVITDPGSGNVSRVFVFDVVVATRVLVVRAIAGLPPLFTFPVGSLVQCGTDHRQVTLIDEPLANGATSVRLKNTFNLTIGARMYFDNGVDFATAVITRIDAAVIRFAPIVVSNAVTLPANTTIAVSQEFNLRTFEKGRFQEVIEGLSMEPENIRDYFASRLAGDANESREITVVDLMPPVLDELMKIPLPVVLSALAGGTEGAPPIDSDYIGSDVPPKSGMQLFGEQPDLNFFSIPGVTTVDVAISAASFADLKGDIIAILDVPLADAQAQDALTYRQIETNIDTSFACMYYPWLVERDPFTGQRAIIPPSGHMQGLWAEVGATRGVQFAPANIPLRNVVDLTHNASNGEHDLLNPNGVNVIRSFQGEGIRCMGARTLTTFLDGRHYINVRRTLNFIKDSMRVGLRFLIMELNIPDTWLLGTLVASEFLETLFARGILTSRDGTKERAFSVKMDEETNPESEVRSGRMNMQVLVNIPRIAEFVIIGLGLSDFGSTISEEIARA